jgi:hypothetical protein
MSNKVKIKIGEFLLIISPDERVNSEVFSIKRNLTQIMAALIQEF